MGPLTQEDPIGIAGGLNLYGYANGDPINFSDPFGLNPLWIAFEIGASIFDAVDLAVTGARYLGGSVSGEDLALTAGGALLGVASFGGGQGRAARVAANRTRGLAAEAAVRGAFDIGDKASILVNGRTRIPDGLTADVLSEVKNVQSLSFTRQLRDFSDYAKAEGLRFDLYVPSGMDPSKMSGPLRNAIEAGDINLRFIPGGN